MNKLMIIFLWTILILIQGNPIGCQAQQEVQKEKQDDGILSKNYKTSKKALETAILVGDKEALRLGLTKDSLPFKKEVVEAIALLNDKSFVPDLITVLKKNQVLMSGGTETEFLQKDLDKMTISAIKELTGLKFEYFYESPTFCSFSECPSDDILKILKESQEWWNKQIKISEM